MCHADRVMNALAFSDGDRLRGKCLAVRPRKVGSRGYVPYESLRWAGGESPFCLTFRWLGHNSGGLHGSAGLATATFSLMECKGHNSDRYKVAGEAATTTGVTTVTKIELSWMDNSAKGKTKKNGPHPSVGSSSSEKVMRSSSLLSRTCYCKGFSLACWHTYEDECH
jgi:hypothetical protein